MAKTLLTIPVIQKTVPGANQSVAQVLTTCSEEILNLINPLDDKKSTDPYDIPVRLLKLSKNIICTYIADIFNNRVQNGIFPDKLNLPRLFLFLNLVLKISLPTIDQYQYYHTFPKYLKN